jgi:hypothetical protein
MFRTYYFMADWAHLHFRARQHAATEPGFLAIRHLEAVNLHGGHLGFCVALGINLATPAGRAAADFHAALIMFCHDRCAAGVGHLPYNPVPLNLGPMGPVIAGPAEGAPGGHGGGPPPDVDHDFVEVIGGVHPVHGPWAVDNDFVEVIGGVHPVHGPWVEGELPDLNMAFDIPAAEVEALANEMWQDMFGHEVNLQGEEDDQGNAPVN